MNSLGTKPTSSKKSRKSHKNDLCPIYTEEILQRYHECSIPYVKNTIPRKLDEQVSLRVVEIMSSNPEELEKIEQELLQIREDDLQDTLSRNTAKNEEERWKKMANSYTIYTRYLQTWQYQSAMKYYKANSGLIMEGYISYMGVDILWDYISKLATTVCTKHTLKKLPKNYGEHLFEETLPWILKRRSDVVKLSQDNIRHIAQFFPLWEQFLLEEEALEI